MIHPMDVPTDEECETEVFRMLEDRMKQAWARSSWASVDNNPFRPVPKLGGA